MTNNKNWHSWQHKTPTPANAHTLTLWHSHTVTRTHKHTHRAFGISENALHLSTLPNGWAYNLWLHFMTLLVGCPFHCPSSNLLLSLCLSLFLFFKSLLPIILLLNYTQLPLACVCEVCMCVCVDDFYDFSKVQSASLPSKLPSPVLISPSLSLSFLPSPFHNVIKKVDFILLNLRAFVTFWFLINFLYFADRKSFAMRNFPQFWFVIFTRLILRKWKSEDHYVINRHFWRLEFTDWMRIIIKQSRTIKYRTLLQMLTSTEICEINIYFSISIIRQINSKDTSKNWSI